VNRESGRLQPSEDVTSQPPIRAGAVRVVTYRRVSTHAQLSGTSPETQLARADRLIAENAERGWVKLPGGDFFDGGISGAQASRKDLNRLFEWCRRGLVDVVVVGDLSRLSRDMRNSLNFEYEFDRLGVAVIDADDPRANELAKMFGYLQNHWMRDQIRKNTHRGRLAVAEAGYWASGSPPFGWRIAAAPDNPKRKVIVRDEEEAATIEKAVELVVEKGKGCYRTAKELNALGFHSRKGPWTDTTLRRMLRRDYLAGDWVLHAEAGKRPIVIHGPEIISADRMAQLHEILDGNEKYRRRSRVRERAYPLSGHVFGQCKQPYWGVYRNDLGLRQYRCRTNASVYDGTERRCWCPRVEADWLEATVWAEVVQLLSDPERLLALANEYLDLLGGEMQAEATEISGLDRRLADAKRKRTNLALAAAGVGPEAVAGALAEINTEIETLEQMLKQARAWAQANAERSALVRDLWRLAEVARENFDSLTHVEQREIYVALDLRVQLLVPTAGPTGASARQSAPLLAEVFRRRRLARGIRPPLRISGVLKRNLSDALS